jgi:hypothetical protein
MLYYTPNLYLQQVLEMMSIHFNAIHVEWWSRKERRIVAWLLAGVWQLKRVRRNTNKERGPFCSGEEDVMYTS